MPYTKYRTTRQPLRATYETICHKPRIWADLVKSLQSSSLGPWRCRTASLSSPPSRPVFGRSSPGIQKPLENQEKGSLTSPGKLASRLED